MVELVPRYAVFGNPVTHSRSPQIHLAFAAETGQTLGYEKILAPLDRFEEAVAEFVDQGGSGFNVTLPFKEQAFRLCVGLDERVERSGAVNTVTIKADGRLFGNNTDGPGLVRDLKENLHWRLEQAKILVVGAGGAVRGILQPLLECGPDLLVIANRTHSRAAQVRDDFSELGNVQARRFAELNEPFDLVINGTAASLSGELPGLPDSVLSHRTCCYDLAYGPRGETAFLTWATERRVQQRSDGLGMLVEQAALSFKIWRGTTPETTSVINEIRRSMEE